MDEHKATLFVIGCRNYQLIFGMTVSNEAYSAYPSEAEVLLSDGCAVHVLAVDMAVKIENETANDIMTRITGKTITVVHLFHYS